MSKTVFNQRDIDFTKQPMFFGEDGGVQRYDEFKYPQFDKLNQTMVGYFWRPGKYHCRRTEQTSRTSGLNRNTYSRLT